MMIKKLIQLVVIFIISSGIILSMNLISSSERLSTENLVNSFSLEGEKQLIVDGFDYISIVGDENLTDTVEVYQTLIWEQKGKKLDDRLNGKMSYNRGKLLYEGKQIENYYIYETNPFLAFYLSRDLTESLHSRYIIKVPTHIEAKSINFRSCYHD